MSSLSQRSRLSKALLWAGALGGSGIVVLLSAQGLQNVWQNIGEHETLAQYAMTAAQTSYAVLGPVAVWLVWRGRRAAGILAGVWAAMLVLALALIVPAWAPEEADSLSLFLGGGALLALCGWGGMWCLSRLRTEP